MVFVCFRKEQGVLFLSGEQSAIISMNIVRVDPGSDTLWEDLVMSQHSDVFHSPAWARVIQQTYDLDLGGYVLTDGTTPHAGMTHCYISDPINDRIVVLPFSDYSDPIISTPAHWHQLIDQMIELQCPISLRCLHNDIPLADERLHVVKKAKWHSIDLTPSADDIWERTASSSRRAIRKAQKSKVEVRVAQHKDDLHTFFKLHLRLRKYKYRLLAQPYRFFEQIWDEFVAKDRGRLYLATTNHKIIGGILMLEWKDTIYYKFSASHQDYLELRPNDLMIWQAINDAKEKGFTLFDFGLSDWDQDGLIRYKQKFATAEKDISFLKYTPTVQSQPSERAHRVQKLLGRLTDLLTDDSVPDDVTDKAGDVLYQFFVS